MTVQSPPTGNGISTVVVFTTAFPFDPVGEVTFLRPELGSLGRQFDRVIVVPSIPGRVPWEESTSQVEIDQSLAERTHPASLTDRWLLVGEAARSPWLTREIARCPRLLLFPHSLGRFIFCAGAARRIGDWLEGRIASGDWDPSATVFYTYWMNYVTAGLGRVRRNVPNLRIVSRAHNCDIYQERYRPPCYPLHPAAIEAADQVFAASHAGRDHLAESYPQHRDKISVAPLGSPEPGFLSRPSDDGRFRIVSCSNLERVKRVDLLVQALAALGARRPDREFEWHHLGGGPEHVAISAMAASLLPKNVRWELLGRVAPVRVMEFYRDHRVDLFLSTTSYEGRPVSMMEAMSCGIPVASTSVGGVPEMVGPARGWLLVEQSSPEGVAELLESISDRESLDEHRSSARRYWETNLDADRNFDRFASTLRALV